MRATGARRLAPWVLVLCHRRFLRTGPLFTRADLFANADTAGTGPIFLAASSAYRRSTAGAHRQSVQTSTTIRLDSAPWPLAGSAATIGRPGDSAASRAPRQPG